MGDDNTFYNEEAVRGEFAKVSDADLARVQQWAAAEQQKRKPNLNDPQVLAARHQANDLEMKRMAGMTEAEWAEHRRKQYGF